MQYHRFLIKIIYILLIILFCTGFPCLMTLLTNHQIDQNETKAVKNSGKYVILSDSGKKIDVEAFLPCAISAYLSPESDTELLKAFAVVLRTQIFSKMGENNSIESGALELPYTTCQEMKKKWKKAYDSNFQKLAKAVADTSLEVLTVDNVLISPPFHQLSSGTTRCGTEKYLPSVSCETDMTDHSYLHTSVYSNEAFLSILKEINPALILSEQTPLASIQIAARDTAGYVTELQIAGSAIDISAFVSKFDLKSACFEIDEYNGGIRILTKGIGDGYGMSLHTAKSLAKSGKEYGEILRYFYVGAEIKPQSNTSQ